MNDDLVFLDKHPANHRAAVNPFYGNKPASTQTTQAKRHYALLPAAPITGSPVPHLTSLYHFNEPGAFGDRRYPGNCGGNLIRDLLP